MGMSIEELRELRIQLKISQREVAKALYYSNSYFSAKEIGKGKADTNFLHRYEKFLTDVIDGKIEVKRSLYTGINSAEYNTIKNPVPREKVAELKTIRKKLKLILRVVASQINMPKATYSGKENGKFPTSQEEYDRFMKYYKQVKLQRIFGANYKEKKHDAN